MEIINDFIITWISFHGIIDIFLPIYLWLPIYSIIPIITIYLPEKSIQYLIVPLTIHHFSNDLDYIYPFNYPLITTFLLLGLYFKELLIVQRSLKLYLCIHTSINIHEHLKEFYIYFTLFAMFNFIYCCKPLIYQIENIIQNPNNISDFKKRIIIGIILSHTLCNL